ncbi:putative diacylglycerol O-acyltransferase [Amphibalanus amphitrite]|uniref:diacylglycerol O-acyltransferase n=1 Tax=Amphibalanus amphitrite TaxID=1232801 RepID=A0A6A4VQS4_AMPAM|nr:putative diacylglycerol O-acyltransferase [Amphibalanus amphitrite]
MSRENAACPVLSRPVRLFQYPDGTETVSLLADCGLRSGRPRRLVHPLDEGIAGSFVQSLLVVAASLTVGICVTLCALLVYPVAAAARRLAAVCSHHLRQYPLKHRLSVALGLMAPQDAQWLLPGGPVQPVYQALLFCPAPFSLHAFRAAVEGRLRVRAAAAPASVGRLFQKVVPVAGGLAWVDDERFAIESHIRTGPELANTAELGRFVSSRLVLPLPADRPLWEAVALPLPDSGETCVLLRAHQALSDGVGLLRVLCHALADAPAEEEHMKPTFGSLTYSLNVLRALFVTPVTLAEWLVASVRQRRPAPALRDWEDADVSLGSLSWEHVCQVKHVTRQSVHEILLALTAGAFRRELQRAGLAIPPDLKVRRWYLV